MKKLSLVIITLFISINISAGYKAQCINIARIKGMSSKSVAVVCSSPTEHTTSCINIARIKGMSSKSVGIACKNATPNTSVCINIARTKGMSSNSVAIACKNASSETAACINIARIQGMSSNSVADLCSEEEMYQNVEGHDYVQGLSEERLRIMLIDTLVNIESNPERAKATIQNILLELELE
ncbi:hypothetical protein A9Q84_16760 [Halobacteriovorax marinus]|uniref:Uncharacterized protein n=1 Tax=Halobacteriovorax marinus TaxID=97084 RepID=A0A1Y5F4U6_9BACT|nr:hypothetical protein A9Q84_16760 [Halobacteriovorax marinus]